jgi:hypothetical protein
VLLQGKIKHAARCGRRPRVCQELIGAQLHCRLPPCCGETADGPNMSLATASYLLQSAGRVASPLCGTIGQQASKCYL